MKGGAKFAVAKAKTGADKESHVNMGTEESERMIYKVVNRRVRSRTDAGGVNVI